MFIIIVFDQVEMGSPDFFLPAFLLPIVMLLFLPSLYVSLSYFILCCSNAPVFGITIVHVFHISYSHAEWYLFFSRRNSPCFDQSFAYQNQTNQHQSKVCIISGHTEFFLRELLHQVDNCGPMGMVGLVGLWPFFVPALLISKLTPLFLIVYSVSLSYFILGVPMSSVREKTYSRVPHYLYHC